MTANLMTDHKFMEAAKTATLKALKGKVKEDKVKGFLDSIGKAEVPAPIGATASLTFVLFYGVVKCEPNEKPYIFEHDVWGVGGAAVSSDGFMYTAYQNWDAFFRQTTAFHVQGIAEGGGILQITWFNKDGLPIGQYNGIAKGIGVFEAGGAGTWKKK